MSSRLLDPGLFLQGHIDARVDMADATDIKLECRIFRKPG
jgi:hypothetical protein